MWAYNREVEPPAPFVEIAIHHPTNLEQSIRIQAKIDTGADVSAIPTSLIPQLQLPVASNLLIEGYDGVSVRVLSYSVLLEIADHRFENWEVIAFPDDYVLLGRDILNYFYVQLNGPDFTFKVSLRPF
jgi:hypothetical protein